MDGGAVCPGNKPGDEEKYIKTSRRFKAGDGSGERADDCDD